jgi:hypothetical protein
LTRAAAGDLAANAIIARFLQALPADAQIYRSGPRWRASDTKALLGDDDPIFTALIGAAESSHAGGLLRFLQPAGEPSLVTWNQPDGWHAPWTALPTAVAFASDWRGNLLLLDPGRAAGGGRRIARFEIASATYEVTDWSLAELLGEILPGHWRELLMAQEFDRWLASGGHRPAANECIDAKVPSFLGGDPVAIENLGSIKLHVAVLFDGSLYEQARRLPSGTYVGGITIQWT